jgi:ParB family chromosome partitioning protein
MHERGAIEDLDPFSCVMWACHDRLEEFINDNSCREVIQSFLKDGQKHPVLARPCKSRRAQYELIFGARRLFAARHLNVRLLATVKEIDDRSAFIEMDIENRLRQDISAYERGTSFKEWLRAGHFESQDEIAKVLGLSAARVSRLMKFAELPTVVVTAFPDPRQIKEAWAVALAERCADPEMRSKIVTVARSLSKGKMGSCDAGEIYKVLLDCKDARRMTRVSRTDDVVRSDDGKLLFRVSYRHNALHIIIPREVAPATRLSAAMEALRNVLETTSCRRLNDCVRLNERKAEKSMAELRRDDQPLTRDG